MIRNTDPEESEHTRRGTTFRVRRNEVYINDEIHFYLKSMVKAMVEGTDASLTIDEFLNGYLRNKITTEFPELVILHDEWIRAKQDARKGYQAVEEKAVKALRPSVEVAA